MNQNRIFLCMLGYAWLSLATPCLAIERSANSSGSQSSPILLDGTCTDQSHIAEGQIGEDLTKRQSRYFCDAVVIMHPNDDPRRVMISFAEKKSHTAAPWAFAGFYEGKDIVTVQRVYLRPKEALPVDEGVCKLFRKNGKIESLFCAAKIDQGNRRTVPMAAFQVSAKTTSEAPATSNERDLTKKYPPYPDAGVATCTCPGTNVEFFIDGNGGAVLTSATSNYVGFKNAAKVKKWSSLIHDEGGKKLLILDNGHNSRIMADPISQKSMGFLADGGVSDMLCQVLVKPR